MGNPGPDPYPEIDPAKWYHIYTDRFGDLNIPDPSCDAPYVDSPECCLLGVAVIAWFVDGYGCQDNIEICAPTGQYSQRITRLRGPFDTWNDCLLDL